jgi:hypothetical protein
MPSQRDETVRRWPGRRSVEAGATEGRVTWTAMPRRVDPGAHPTTAHDAHRSRHAPPLHATGVGSLRDEPETVQRVISLWQFRAAPKPRVFR